jgi:choline-sulfatase
VGLVGPHCPFVCPDELFRKYFDSVSLPPCSPEHLAALHPYSRRFRERSRITDLSEHEIRRTLAAYYGMIEFDDRLLGTILEALGGAGLADDTVVIYTSDHGDQAGEHGLWWKMSFYEGSAAVPLIVSWPGRFPQGQRDSTPVTLAELAPTLAELGGAGAIPGVRSPGFADVLRTGRGDPDRAAFVELIGDSCLLPEGPTGPPARMMRKGPWKAIYYHHEPPELFNLADDPFEMNDLAADPACKAILDAMLAEILREWDPDEVEASARRLRELRTYLRGAPTDPDVLAGEYWTCPAGYSAVHPV